MMINGVGLRIVFGIFAAVGAVIGFVLFAFRVTTTLWAVPIGALAVPAIFAALLLLLLALDTYDDWRAGE